jgi:hypothetical protein
MTGSGAYRNSPTPPIEDAVRPMAPDAASSTLTDG